jgi:hypothetical protein
MNLKYKIGNTALVSIAFAVFIFNAEAAPWRFAGTTQSYKRLFRRLR